MVAAAVSEDCWSVFVKEAERQGVIFSPRSDSTTTTTTMCTYDAPPTCLATPLENMSKEDEMSATTDTSRRSSQRQVTFCLQANQEILLPLDDGTDDSSDRQVRWYSKLEYNAWEAIVAKTAKHMRHEPRRPFSYTHVWEHVDHVVHHSPVKVDDHWRLPREDRAALERLVQRGAPIGLERWAVPRLETHGEARKRQQYKLVAASSSRNTYGGGGDSNNDERVTDTTVVDAWNNEQEDRTLRLAEDCQRVSRPGRLLALAAAQALATVLRNEPDSRLS